MNPWAPDPHPPAREVDHSADPLAEMARIRVRKCLTDKAATSFEGTIEEIINTSLERNPTSWSESTRKIMHGVVESVHDQDDAEEKIRVASESAVLAVARRWGNVVLAGKATVLATRDVASKHGLNSASAARQAGLGAMEGVRRVGPVAYPILQRELEPIVEDFGDALEQHRSKEWLTTSEERPVIVFDSTPSSEGFDAAEDHQVLVEDEPPPVVERPRPMVKPPTSRLTPPSPPPKKPGLWQRLVNSFKGLFRK